jgi:putative transcriptional regulator
LQLINSHDDNIKYCTFARTGNPISMIIKAERTNPAAGRILISEPFLKDFYFQRSIILLADHNKDGSFGLIMNKPVEVKLHEIIPDFPEFDADVYLGGPVKTDNLYFIHSLGEEIENSLKIIDGIYWGGDIDIVHDMIEHGKVTNDKIRFFLGYSGWSSNQLEDELKENSWLVADVKANQLLTSHPEKMWKNIVSKLGGDFSDWINYPADPTMN